MEPMTMTDDAARKMAQEIIEMLPLFWRDVQQGREDKLMDGDEVEIIAARLRPLLAERDALREFAASVRDCPAFHLMPLAAKAALAKHATAGQPQSEGGEGSVAPGPVPRRPPSPAVAHYTPTPKET
jgi:hypothetical protein